MADLNITADFRDVEQLQAILGNLGPQFGRVVARIQREMKQMENATKASASVLADALDEVVGATAQRNLAQWGAAQRRRLSLMQESERIALKQANAERQVTQELIRQQDAAEQLARANAQRVQSQIGANLGLGAQGIDAGASADAFASQIERLRVKYDQVYAASQIYERSLDEINQAHLFGITSVKQHEAALESLNAEYAAFQNGTANSMNRFTQGVGLARQRMSEWGVVTQQAGYQVGDFLVQIQSGTNWMVAFGQQATQLVGVLPLMGGALGMSVGTLTAMAAGLGIAIPLITALGAAWMRTSEEVKNESGIEEKLKSIQQETENLQEKWDNLKFGNAGQAAIEELKAQASLLRAEIESLDLRAQATSTRAAALIRTQVAAKQAELEATVDILNKLEEEEAKRRNIAAQLARAEAINKAMMAIELGHARAIGDRVRRAEELAKAIEKGKDFAEKLRTAINSIGDKTVSVQVNFKAAFSGFTGMAAQWVSDTLATREWGDLGSLGEGYMPSSPRPQAAPTGIGGIDWGDSSGGGGGGGGGGGSDPYKAKIESLIESLKTEKEILEEWHLESQDLLARASEAELEALGGKNEAKLRLEREYQDRLKEVLSEEKNYRLTEMGNMFGALADLAGVGGKKMLKVQATLSAAATTIAAYETAVKAASEAKTIPGRIAAYAKFLATGLGAVKAIRSAGGIGGGGGDSRGTSSVSSGSIDPGPQTVYIDSLDPAGLYSGQMLINLFDAFYNENDKRGKVFVVGK